MQLRTQIHLKMLDGNRRHLRQAVERGHADVLLGTQAADYVARLARLVREGRHDSQDAVNAASRLARAVSLTPALVDERADVR